MARCPGAFGVVAAMILTAGTSYAQGHRGAPPGQAKTPGPPPSSGSPAMPPAEVSTPPLRTFGVWLDDATLAQKGTVWLTTGVTRWTSPVASGMDLPSFDVAAGLSRRAQFTLLMPRSTFTDQTGRTWSGLGDTYAGVKLLLHDGRAGGVGLSTTPMIEVLDSAAAAGGVSNRVHFVLPISIEAGGRTARVYGSAGYFTRGATFVSGALEVHATRRVSVTGAVFRSWSTADASTAAAMGLSRRRTDIAGAVTAFVTPGLAAFASIGRTISPLEFDSSSFLFEAGFAVNLAPWRATPVRPPK